MVRVDRGLARWDVVLNRAVIDEQLQLCTYGSCGSPLVNEVVNVAAVTIPEVPLITLVTQAASPVKKILHRGTISLARSHHDACHAAMVNRVDIGFVCEHEVYKFYVLRRAASSCFQHFGAQH